MKAFITELNARDSALFIFGAVNFAAALAFFLASRFTDIQVAGTNAWYKPLKFALSIGIYAWTMAWFLHYLGEYPGMRWTNWIIIGMLGFELAYIGLQAGRGMLSHYNLSTPGYAGLYILMAAAATIVTLWTAHIGVLFFKRDFPDLPEYYVWAIRLGILLFVGFSLEGFVMGSRMSHTIGGPDGEEGLPFLNWSRKYGDPRLAHFIGMHALQVLPILSYYVLKNVKLTIVVSILYALMALYVLAQALLGKPFIR